MGSVCGKDQQVSPRELEERVQAERIDQRIRRETKADKDVPKKLLLLGAGESGKSTIFKQIKVLFQEGFADGERINYKTVIYANVFQSMKILLDGLQEFAQSDQEKYTLKASNKVQVGESLRVKTRELGKGQGMVAIGEELAEVGGRSELPLLTQDYAKKLELLWKDPAVQEDVLFARVRTSGIVETTFRPGRSDLYKLYDVGGQRNERKKWIHLFEGVTAVIFCAALSEYDQTLSEDENTNRMVEARDLFDWVLKQSCFKETSFLLFLNKFDLFEQKIHKVPLSVCEWFSDYKPVSTGRAEVSHAYQYVEKKFREVFHKNTNAGNVRRVFQVYRTTAVDKTLVEKTFNLVDEALTRELLSRGGFI
ncbi:hypothetical protein AXG93_3217s1580 [Marchantia polymorpha subsp. ruderalis]|uniref:Guanine nucleotide-binding protein alpha subunit n=1 Tax=Marchantia polymorpha subsp. ruderalis TaxID=1480154 RepID=A0A176VXR7_MARPO|nr:hypothetical protein AXG93_3217s1580 [Marchantia polymorpha subsp. ruderalis]